VGCRLTAAVRNTAGCCAAPGWHLSWHRSATMSFWARASSLSSMCTLMSASACRCQQHLYSETKPSELVNPVISSCSPARMCLPEQCSACNCQPAFCMGSKHMRWHLSTKGSIWVRAASLSSMCTLMSASACNCIKSCHSQHSNAVCAVFAMQVG